MREQARGGVFKYTGMWQSLRVIAQEEGRAGLYSGMGIHLIKVVPNSALMFLTYEVVKGWLSEFTVIDENGRPVQ
jgi:solute carrier family 25 protein 33/36